ncbi:acetyl-CoA carboxylase biotin carboxylase subunit family protein [Nocardia sp. NPDC060256]|uniref:ATP-grasp domain-containing protein n=1 Tax=unclassified Nocardia TaxID=2637762 RepID=UPI00365E229F
MPRGQVLAVAYDLGAASATEIAASLGDVAELVFLVADSEHTREVRPVLAEFGRCVPVTGDIATDAAAIRAFAPRAVVTFSEPMLRFASGVAAELGLPFHQPETTWLLTDKFAQRARLRSAGVDSVRSARIDKESDWWPALARVGMPAVVKPAWGGGSEDTHFLPDAAAARRVLAELSDRLSSRRGWVVEEYLQGRPGHPYGDYVSVESFCGPHGPVHVALTGKFPLEPPFRECGQFWPAALPAAEQAQVVDLVTRALAALDMRIGMAHTEVKLTTAEPRIIEVNGRLGGNIQDLALRSRAADLVRVCGLAALGEPVRIAPAQPDKVYFQYMFLTPIRPCRMVAAHGVENLREVAGITTYRAAVRPGDLVPGGVGTRQIGQLYGVAEDHRAMFEILASALSELSFDFVGADGEQFTLTRR